MHRAKSQTAKQNISSQKGRPANRVPIHEEKESHECGGSLVGGGGRTRERKGKRTTD